MSYLVLARKYRPIKFDDLIGQTQVSHTLTQAIATGRLAHAYLFTGPRGVGKTTAARLLSMALSCQAQGDRPCGQCPSCNDIQNGQAVDVIEVDGASNRGVDEIRGLRETVKYLPTTGRYKVYIIDEVHALTKDAFNALLKTLEEPPGHVVFIFATTEAHKVPATILSRCQRFDFRRIRVDDIVKRLTQVAQAENIPFELDALAVLARQAEGGLRDALGLMDQVIASGGTITLSSVSEALGLVGLRLVEQAALAALTGNTREALSAMEQAWNLGSDLKEMGLKILEYVRNLSMYKAAPESAEFLNLTDAEEESYKRVLKDISLATIHRHFEAWLKIQGDLSRHPQPRWLLEALLIRLCQLPALADLTVLSNGLLALLEAAPEQLKNQIPSLSAALKVKPKESVEITPGRPKTEKTVPDQSRPSVAGSVLTDSSASSENLTTAENMDKSRAAVPESGKKPEPESPDFINGTFEPKPASVSSPNPPPTSEDKTLAPVLEKLDPNQTRGPIESGGEDDLGHSLATKNQVSPEAGQTATLLSPPLEPSVSNIDMGLTEKSEIKPTETNPETSSPKVETGKTLVTEDRVGTPDNESTLDTATSASTQKEEEKLTLGQRRVRELEKNQDYQELIQNLPGKVIAYNHAVPTMAQPEADEESDPSAFDLGESEPDD